jgi:hypothetical protein
MSGGAVARWRDRRREKKGEKGKKDEKGMQRTRRSGSGNAANILRLACRYI